MSELKTIIARIIWESDCYNRYRPIAARRSPEDIADIVIEAVKKWHGDE